MQIINSKPPYIPLFLSSKSANIITKNNQIYIPNEKKHPKVLYSFGSPSHHHNNLEIRICSISEFDHEVCEASASTKERIDSALNR